MLTYDYWDIPKSASWNNFLSTPWNDIDKSILPIAILKLYKDFKAEDYSQLTDNICRENILGVYIADNLIGIKRA